MTPPLTEWLSFSLLILTVFTAATAIAYRVYKVAKRMEDTIGIDEQGRTLSERMSRVEHQLWPNGGDSLADQVDKIEISSRETAVEVRLIRDMMISVVDGLAASKKSG